MQGSKLVLVDQMMSSIIRFELSDDGPGKGFYGLLEPPIYLLIIGIIGFVICLLLVCYLLMRIVMTFGDKIVKYFENRKELLSIKSKYLSVINDIETHFTDGVISDNEALFELSRAIRNYASEKIGDNFTVLTYHELRGKNIPLAAQAVGDIYFSEFSNRDKDPNPMPISEALKIARGLIGGW